MTEKKEGSCKKIRKLFEASNDAITIADIRKTYPELKPNEISMALCYLLKQEYLNRQLIENSVKGGRKNVYSYTKTVKVEHA